jgi:hypothetical protein
VSQQGVSVDFLAAAVRFLSKRDGCRSMVNGDDGMSRFIAALAAAEEAWLAMPETKRPGTAGRGEGGGEGPPCRE